MGFLLERSIASTGKEGRVGEEAYILERVR